MLKKKDGKDQRGGIILGSGRRREKCLKEILNIICLDYSI